MSRYVGPNGGTLHGLDVETRFWMKVQKTDGCWIWTASTQGGYGQMFTTHDRRPPVQRAPRISWEIHHGPIPEGMHVCHHCDTPLCVRPDHLFLGTPSDNMADCARKGRVNRQSLRGMDHPRSKLTEDDVREIRRLRASGVLLREIADQFGIGTSQARRIAERESWGHVPDDPHDRRRDALPAVIGTLDTLRTRSAT